MSSKRYDVIVVGGGHNGLISAKFMSDQGLKVLVLEANPVFGGACRTEYPFKKAPKLGASTGAYLLGPMPPKLYQMLDMKLKPIKRDPHYFLPTRGSESLLLGSNDQANRDQILKMFSKQDWDALCRMQADIALVRDAVADTWLEEPCSLEEKADACFCTDAEREAFINLCSGTVMDYLDRFGFKSDLLKAMYAVTDGLIGSWASWDTPGTGFNFLLHNMCKLPDSGGAWMLVEGGMGAIANELCRIARAAGAELRANARVSEIIIDGKSAKGVVLEGGEEISADAVMVNADPFTMRGLVGDDNLPQGFISTLDDYSTKPGATMKINLCLDGLPTFKSLPINQGQFQTTAHFLPEESEVLAKISEAFDCVKRGELPPYPCIEMYTHTVLDPSLKSGIRDFHNAAFFVQLVPNKPVNGTWQELCNGYVHHILSIADEFAPDFSSRVVEHFTLTPQGIENHFGIKGGHILHVDSFWNHDKRLPYAAPEVENLFFCGAAFFPGGAVIGAPGYNASQSLLRAFGKIS